MNNNTFRRCDYLMRVFHQYTGLFLVPWMLVYAVSAFCLNHNKWFTEGLNLRPKLEKISEVDFTPGPEFPEDPQDQAAAILEHVDLDGPHRILSKPNAKKMDIFRYCATGNYRVWWLPAKKGVIVNKQQPTSFFLMANILHFRCGYQPHFAFMAWAVVVDLVAVSMVIWVISGIWIWARKSRKRFLGGICLSTGILVFLVLVTLLSQ